MFNLYYALDPCGARLEPILNPQLATVPPVSVPRYQKYPHGDGRPIHFDRLFFFIFSRINNSFIIIK